MPISASFFSNSEFGQTALLNRGVALDYQEIFPFAGFDNDPGNFAWSADPGMDPTTYLAKTPEGRIRAETIDLVLASNEPDLRKDFEDKEVEILGQYLPPEKKLDEEVTNSDFLLVRVFMLCCAADARPIGVSVRGKIPQSVQPSDWVLVRGFARFLRKKQTFSPLVEATEILPTAPPQQRNLFHNN
ncbi:MAG: hypothetical protein N2035_02220 [Chthoniobacterales bacterium]|nr:hypothetical protein [Chthoniobacterales bacterium]